MITTFEQWIETIISENQLSSDYQDKVKKSLSNKQLFDLACDSNGISYICELGSKGLSLPYDVILDKFGSFINGKYVSNHVNEKGNGYTSAIYCRFYNHIVAKQTLLSILGCNCTIEVKNNHICQIYIDNNSDVEISCPNSSMAIVHYWGKEPKCVGNVELIKEI